MDADPQNEHQQKDFLASLFSEIPMDGSGAGFHQQSMNPAAMTSGSQQTPMSYNFDHQAQPMDMQRSSPSHATPIQLPTAASAANLQHNMDALNTLMAQLSDSSPNHQQTSTNGQSSSLHQQQMLMEQQFKLQQLQQLQNLQIQIFHQQVRFFYAPAPPPDP